MRILTALIVVFILGSCANSIPYTEKLRSEYDLTPEKLKKIQFYTSETIILERSEDQSKMVTTGKSGEVVKSETSTSERVIIPARRKGILERVEEDGSVLVRFEVGQNKFLSFKERPNISNGRLYLEAQWVNGRGELDYGNAVYFAVRGSSSAYLMVKLKDFSKQQHKDRVVKGTKVN